MRFKHFFIAGILAFCGWLNALAADTSGLLSANLGSREVNLSVPVGGDVLPGGSFNAADIKTSFAFAKLIPFALKYALGLAAALTVIALIIGGYRLMTTYGNPEKQQAARKTIQYALIGLIVAITAFGIVTIITQFTFS